jgi:hypothetical protein
MLNEHFTIWAAVDLARAVAATFQTRFLLYHGHGARNSLRDLDCVV